MSVSVAASDNCDESPQSIIADVNSNEPTDGLGDGDKAPDWEITGDLTVDLRAKRSGTGSGRVYTISVKCCDAWGNTATQNVEVTVPHDQGKKEKKRGKK
ncbi:MAG: hypothetical protein DRG87_00185 [Deltaproteobacteria bacterium]|nr:MAG: hypothetical protein DRG87_00185 [Deltaproteobacteria bacterium]